MKKKIACFLLATLILLSCMAGCESGSTVWSLVINNENIPIETLLTINSEKISLFEYRFYFALRKKAADGGDDSYWISNQDARDKLITDTLNAIRYDRAKAELANSLGLKITRGDKSDVKKYVKNYKSVYTAEKWQQMLDESYLDEALFIKRNYNVLYDSKLEDYYFGDNGENKLTLSTTYEYMKGFYHYKYIYVKLDYDNTNTNKDLMTSLKKQLDDGAKFEDLMVYSRDYTEDSAKTGYYIKQKGVSPAIDAVSKLEVGQVSDVIENDNGYYIYKRYDITEDDVRQNLQEFKNQYIADFIDEKVNELIKKQEIEYVSEYYNKISIETLLHD